MATALEEPPEIHAPAVRFYPGPVDLKPIQLRGPRPISLPLPSLPENGSFGEEEPEDEGEEDEGFPHNFTAENRPYTARGAALALWRCRDDEILIEGPAGTGKTRAILEKVHFCMLKYPGARALLVRKTRESLNETVLVTLEEKVLPAGSPALRGPARRLRQLYRFPNGSIIVVGGMDKLTKVMSSEYDIIATFESTELFEEDFEALTTRLRNGVMPYQQILSDCNPDRPNHWLNRRPEMKNEDGTPKMTRLLSKHEDNPAYFELKPDGSLKPTELGLKYLRKLANLTGVRRIRLFMGKWAASEGMVYDNWDPAVHIVDRYEIPADWKRYRVFDFGFRNPFVCQWWAEDPDGDLVMYREYYKTAVLVKDAAAVVNLMSAGEKFEANIADHDPENCESLREAGISTVPAYKDFERGRDAVYERLKVKKNKKPGITIMRDCLIETDQALVDAKKPICTLQEIEGYVYKKTEDGKPIKEEPVKQDDHGVDAARYVVAFVDNLQGMQVQVIAAEAASVMPGGSSLNAGAVEGRPTYQG